MTDLKTRIARGEYEIDSAQVAEAMLSKLRTVKRVHGQMNVTRRTALRAGRFDAARLGEYRSTA